MIWDFDETLGYRPGRWRGLLMEILDEHIPDHGVESDQLLPFLRNGFPWHQPHVAHPELCEAAAWWHQIEQLLADAYTGVGLNRDRAAELARHARHRFIDPTRGWRLFEDTRPVLERLADGGWTHAILSNHVPELPDLIAGLGLSTLVKVVQNVRNHRVRKASSRGVQTCPDRVRPSSSSVDDRR